MRAFDLSFALVLVLACGPIACAGKETSDRTDATSDATSADADAPAEFDLGLDTYDSGCPMLPSPEPREGQPCAPDGLDCGGYGSLSCPEHAICVGGVWQIHCALHPFGSETGTCGCAHPG